jgi:hypothetical protein
MRVDVDLDLDLDLDVDLDHVDPRSNIVDIIYSLIHSLHPSSPALPIFSVSTRAPGRI